MNNNVKTTLLALAASGGVALSMLVTRFDAGEITCSDVQEIVAAMRDDDPSLVPIADAFRGECGEITTRGDCYRILDKNNNPTQFQCRRGSLYGPGQGGGVPCEMEGKRIPCFEGALVNDTMNYNPDKLDHEAVIADLLDGAKRGRVKLKKSLEERLEKSVKNH